MSVAMTAGLQPSSARAADVILHAAADAAARNNYDIPAGPLDMVLSRFAAAAGLALSFDAALVSDLRSAGIRGAYSGEDGLRQLLEGTDLVLVPKGNASFALSRRAPGAAPLPAVRVTESMAPGSNDPITDGTGSYVVNAVTIGKAPLALREIPQSVSVITRQQMDDQNLVTVDQALRQVTGVTTNLYGDTTAGFMARGYGLQAQYDGVPASAGLQMTPQFDLAMVDRIEVLRGASGLLQGAGNPSGSVNFVRKRPQREFSMSSSVSAGSFDNYHADVDIGGPLNQAGTLRGRAVVSAQDKGAANGVQNNRQIMGYAILEADVSADTTLSLSASVQRKNTLRFMGIPTRTSTGQPIASDPSSFYGADGSYSHYPMSEVLGELTHRLGDTGWVAHVALRQKNITSDLLYGYVSSSVTDADLATTTLVRSYYRERSNGADFNVRGPFSWLGRQHSMVLGYNIDNYRYEGGRRTTSLAGQSIYRRNYDLDSVPAITANTGRRIRQSGMYGTARLQLNDVLTLTLGARVSDYAYESRTLTPVATDWKRGERANGKVTPYGGLVWKLSSEHSAYVSYSDIFAPQDAFDKNGRLPAKLGWQVETGIKSGLLGGRLNTTAAIYRIQEKNRAITDTQNTGCDGPGNTCSTAAGLVQSQGIELEAIGRLAPGWDLSAGYTYNANAYLRDGTASNVGKPYSTITPRHLFKLWSNYRLKGDWNRFSVGAGLQAQSATYQALTAGTLHQGGYAVVGVQIGYRIGDASNLTLTINNLTDRRYYERLGNQWGYTYYGESRSAMLSLRTMF